jgi:hypothetical protein
MCWWGGIASIIIGAVPKANVAAARSVVLLGAIGAGGAGT